MLRRSLLALAGALLLAAPASAQSGKTLRVVMHSDLKILDPVWTTAYIVRNHGYLIYDQLFALDGNLEIKPQMVDTWTVSDDQLTWIETETVYIGGGSVVIQALLAGDLHFALAGATGAIRATLNAMQVSLYEKALAFRESQTQRVDDWATFEKVFEGEGGAGFVLAHWDGTPETEAKIKEELGLTTRNRPFDLKQEPGKCVKTGNPSPGRIVFSKAY